MNAEINTLGNQKLTNNFVLFVYLFICIWGIKSPDKSNMYIYFVTAIIFIYTLLYVLLCKRGLLKRACKSNMIIMHVFLATYIYGIMIGFLKGNYLIYIVRNHSGMLMYVAAPFIIANLNINEILIRKLIKFGGILLTILMPFMYFLFFILKPGGIYGLTEYPLLNSFSTGVQNIGYTLEYHGMVLIYAVYAYALFEFMYNANYRYFIVILWDAIVICVCTLSAGRVLELIMLTFFAILGLAKSKPVGRNKLILLVMLIISFLAFPILFAGILGLENSGNDVRYRQISFILSNLTLEGNGLGATYSAIGQGYGIETVYLDLVFKLGLFVIPVLLVYVFSYIQSFKLLKSTNGDWIDIMPLVFMGYLWVSLGNPDLFGGGNVVSHILAMEIITLRKNKESMLRCIYAN